MFKFINYLNHYISILNNAKLNNNPFLTVFSNRIEKKLVNLSGTIPVTFKGKSIECF